MKPKHRIFCIGCHHQKMLFDSQEAAERFIAFNAGDFKGKVPVRGYFCTFCGGWHLTSREADSSEILDDRDDKVWEAIRIANSQSRKLTKGKSPKPPRVKSMDEIEVEKMLDELSAILFKFRVATRSVEFEEANNCKEQFILLSDRIKPRIDDYENLGERLKHYNKIFDSISGSLQELEGISHWSDEQISEVAADPFCNTRYINHQRVAALINRRRRCDRLIEEISSLIENDGYYPALEKLHALEIEIRGIRGSGCVAVRHRYNTMANQLRSLIPAIRRRYNQEQYTELANRLISQIENGIAYHRQGDNEEAHSIFYAASGTLPKKCDDKIFGQLSEMIAKWLTLTSRIINN